MNDNGYDGIVIGAGLGGLTAAVTLARSGLRVLLLERHNVPGGYATSFVRNRFEFEVALHELSGIGPPGNRGLLYDSLDALGVAGKVEFLQVPDLYRSVFPGLDITLPPGRDAYVSTLCERFPREADGIRRFMNRAFDLNRELTEYQRNKGPGNLLTAPSRMKNTVRYLPVTWGQVLDRDVQDPAARAVLSQYWGYFGLPPSQVSYLYFANALAGYILQGASFVKGRSQALSGAFLSVLEEAGGVLRLNCGVARIQVSGGRVTGVVTEDGEEIPARFVVSNADPVSTCRDMIGVDKVPSSFFRQLRSRTLAMSTVNVYLGVARSMEELGIRDHEVFVNNSFDHEGQFRGSLGLGAPEGMALTCYNAVWPEISPPGTSVLVLTAPMMGEPWYNVPPGEYVDTKNRIAGGLLRMAEQVVPDLRDHVEELEVSTPLTNMRYAGTLGGSIYGFAQPAHDHTVLRIKHRGPVGGLYFVGAWTQPGGGFEPAMMSGEMAGELVLKEWNKGKKRGAYST